MRETWVRFLGWEDPLEKGTGYPLQYSFFFFFFLSTPVFWPGEFQGLYSPWGRKESDTTEQLSLSLLSYTLLCL